GRIETELRELSQPTWLLHAAGRFVGQTRLEDFFKGGEREHPGTKLDLVVLFADIRDFTKLSEALDPRDLVANVNRCMAAMARCVEREGGHVDKFLGDAVMAVFGLDQARNAAERAVRAGLFMHAELQRLNKPASSVR